MKWENVKTKLLSRKFWLMITTLVGLILVALNVDAFTVEKIIGVITSFSILAIYILGETMTDIVNRKFTTGEKMVVSVAQKLSSRKFWAALISFISTLMITLGVDALTIEQVEAMIMAVATVAIYILGESAIDVSKIKTELKQALKEVEDEKKEITNNIVGQVIPAMARNWMPLIISASNGVCCNVYADPSFMNPVAMLPNNTTIYVEPTGTGVAVIYGSEQEPFLKFVTEGIDEEMYIPVTNVQPVWSISANYVSEPASCDSEISNECTTIEPACAESVSAASIETSSTEFEPACEGEMIEAAEESPSVENNGVIMDGDEGSPI